MAISRDGTNNHSEKRRSDMVPWQRGKETSRQNHLKCLIRQQGRVKRSTLIALMREFETDPWPDGLDDMTDEEILDLLFEEVMDEFIYSDEEDNFGDPEYRDPDFDEHDPIIEDYMFLEYMGMDIHGKPIYMMMPL